MAVSGPSKRLIFASLNGRFREKQTFELIFAPARFLSIGGASADAVAEAAHHFSGDQMTDSMSGNHARQ
jgi:hypothetical protein